MDQRHQEYTEYYKARLAKFDGNPLYPHSAAAERAMYQAISTASSLEEFGQRVHAEKLEVACAVAYVRDRETAEANFWQERGEHVRAGSHLEILKALDETPPQSAQDLVTLVTTIADKWNLRISEDESLRADYWNDYKIMEDIESYETTQVPERWHQERAESAHRDSSRGVDSFNTVTLPERRKFFPNWEPNWAALSEPRHRRHFPISDEVFNHRLATHKKYWGRG